tara:strand:- start:1039 stop:1548 length:510 start_codon:yes stop_codon:yes gene_type:complete
MIKLANGRGQLGESLKKLIEDKHIEKKVFVYHTWSPWEKDRAPQKKEYEKFINFVERNKENRIVFISTYSQDNNYYVHYKHLSESYLLQNCQDCLVIRLPSLVGNKGILKKFKDDAVSPYGSLELMPLEEASKKIFDLLDYDGLAKIITLKGEQISAFLVKDIINKLTR